MPESAHDMSCPYSHYGGIGRGTAPPCPLICSEDCCRQKLKYHQSRKLPQKHCINRHIIVYLLSPLYGLRLLATYLLRLFANIKKGCLTMTINQPPNINSFVIRFVYSRSSERLDPNAYLGYIRNIQTNVYSRLYSLGRGGNIYKKIVQLGDTPNHPSELELICCSIL
jgi:hypothetical protein